MDDIFWLTNVLWSDDGTNAVKLAEVLSPDRRDQIVREIFAAVHDSVRGSNLMEPIPEELKKNKRRYTIVMDRVERERDRQEARKRWQVCSFHVNKKSLIISAFNPLGRAPK